MLRKPGSDIESSLCRMDPGLSQTDLCRQPLGRVWCHSCRWYLACPPCPIQSQHDRRRC